MGKGKGKGEKENLTRSKGIDKIPKYGGQLEKYASWKYKLEVFLESEVPAYTHFLRWLEKEPEGVTLTQLEKFQEDNSHIAELDVPFMSKQLYLILASTLEESSGPLAIVQGLHEETAVRGPRAWQAVIKDAVGMSGNRLQALATRVHTPPRAMKYSEVATAIERWAGWLREYEAGCGSEHKVPDVAKITALRQLVPKELDQDIGRQAGLKTLEEVRSYISEQVLLRREPFFVKTPGASSNDPKLNELGGESRAEEKWPEEEGWYGEWGLRHGDVLRRQGKGQGAQGGEGSVQGKLLPLW